MLRNHYLEVFFKLKENFYENIQRKLLSRGAKAREAELWNQYIINRDSAIHQELVQFYTSLAIRIARHHFALRTIEQLEYSEFEQYAIVGLLEAISKYRPNEEASFSTYATYRIRGSILNGIEKMSEKTAQVTFRKRVKQERLQSLLNKDKKDNPNTFEEMVDVSIGLAIGYMLEDSGMFRDTEASNDDNPYKKYELKRVQERLALVVEELPDVERKIIIEHYFKHRPFVEIASELQLSKGRVSQLHARALEIIKEVYEKLGDFNAHY